jgi:hypothetical protein
MLNRLLAALTTLCSLFQSHRRLALENLALRQQVAMLKSSVKRLHASALDRAACLGKKRGRSSFSQRRNPTPEKSAITPNTSQM